MQMSTAIETDNGEMIVKRVSVPIGLEELMEGLTKEVMLKKPKDIYVFASQYFAHLLDLREKGSFKGISGKRAQSVTKQISTENGGKLLKKKSRSIDPIKQLTRQTSIRSESPAKKTLSAKKIILTPKEDKNEKTDKAKLFLDKRKARKGSKDNLSSNGKQVKEQAGNTDKNAKKTPRIRERSVSQSSQSKSDEDSLKTPRQRINTGSKQEKTATNKSNFKKSPQKVDSKTKSKDKEAIMETILKQTPSLADKIEDSDHKIESKEESNKDTDLVKEFEVKKSDNKETENILSVDQDVELITPERSPSKGDACIGCSLQDDGAVDMLAEKHKEETTNLSETQESNNNVNDKINNQVADIKSNGESDLNSTKIVEKITETDDVINNSVDKVDLSKHISEENVSEMKTGASNSTEKENKFKEEKASNENLDSLSLIKNEENNVQIREMSQTEKDVKKQIEDNTDKGLSLMEQPIDNADPVSVKNEDTLRNESDKNESREPETVMKKSKTQIGENEDRQESDIKNKENDDCHHDIEHCKKISSNNDDNIENKIESAKETDNKEQLENTITEQKIQTENKGEETTGLNETTQKQGNTELEIQEKTKSETAGDKVTDNVSTIEDNKEEQDQNKETELIENSVKTTNLFDKNEINNSQNGKDLTENIIDNNQNIDTNGVKIKNRTKSLSEEQNKDKSDHKIKRIKSVDLSKKNNVLQTKSKDKLFLNKSQEEGQNEIDIDTKDKKIKGCKRSATTDVAKNIEQHVENISHQTSFDSAKLREELKEAGEATKGASFKTNYNPYKLRQEIKQASKDPGEENTNEISKVFNEIAAAIKIQSMWRGFTIRKNKSKLTDKHVEKENDKDKHEGKIAEEETVKQSATIVNREPKTEESKLEDSDKSSNENKREESEVKEELGQQIVTTPNQEAITEEKLNIVTTSLDKDVMRKNEEKANHDAIAEAVLKIQALWRGFKVRKHLTQAQLFGSEIKAQTKKREVLEVTKKIDESKAVNKIQAFWRGYKVRKNIKEVNKHMAELQKPAECDEMPNQRGPTDEDIFNAASKIQAGVRGYIVRKKRGTNNNNHLKSIDEEVPEEKLSDEHIVEAMEKLQDIPNESPNKISDSNATDESTVTSNVIDSSDKIKLNERKDETVATKVEVKQVSSEPSTENSENTNLQSADKKSIENVEQVEDVISETTGNQMSKNNTIDTKEDNKKTENQVEFMTSKLNSATTNKLSNSETFAIIDDSISNSTINKDDVDPVSVTVNNEHSYEDAPTRPVTSNIIQEQVNNQIVMGKTEADRQNKQNTEAQNVDEHSLKYVNDQNKNSLMGQSEKMLNKINEQFTQEELTENDKTQKEMFKQKDKQEHLSSVDSSTSIDSVATVISYDPEKKAVEMIQSKSGDKHTEDSKPVEHIIQQEVDNKSIVFAQVAKEKENEMQHEKNELDKQSESENKEFDMSKLKEELGEIEKENSTVKNELENKETEGKDGTAAKEHEMKDETSVNSKDNKNNIKFIDKQNTDFSQVKEESDSGEHNKATVHKDKLEDSKIKIADNNEISEPKVNSNANEQTDDKIVEETTIEKKNATEIESTENTENNSQNIPKQNSLTEDEKKIVTTVISPERDEKDAEMKKQEYETDKKDNAVVTEDKTDLKSDENIEKIENEEHTTIDVSVTSKLNKSDTGKKDAEKENKINDDDSLKLGKTEVTSNKSDNKTKNEDITLMENEALGEKESKEKSNITSPKEKSSFTEDKSPDNFDIKTSNTHHIDIDENQHKNETDKLIDIENVANKIESGTVSKTNDAVETMETKPTEPATSKFDISTLKKEIASYDNVATEDTADNIKHPELGNNKLNISTLQEETTKSDENLKGLIVKNDSDDLTDKQQPEKQETGTDVTMTDETKTESSVSLLSNIENNKLNKSQLNDEIKNNLSANSNKEELDLKNETNNSLDTEGRLRIQIPLRELSDIKEEDTDIKSSWDSVEDLDDESKSNKIESNEINYENAENAKGNEKNMTKDEGNFECEKNKPNKEAVESKLTENAIPERSKSLDVLDTSMKKHDYDKMSVKKDDLVSINLENGEIEQTKLKESTNIATDIKTKICDQDDTEKPNQVQKENQEKVEKESKLESKIQSPTAITISQKENLEVPGSTTIKLVHSGEFHDTITVPISVSPPRRTSSAEGEHNASRQMSPQGLVNTGELHDNVLPLSVQLNEAPPAGAEILTSHESKSINNDGQDRAQASNKDASTCETQPDNTTPSPASMETEKRNNASIPKKSMEAEAATKIQAGFRGYQVRKQLKGKVSSPGDISNQRRSARRKSSGRLTDSGRISHNKSKTPSDIEEKSAVKIQAGVRGFLVRRRQKKQKQGKE